jgi:hypothetical protein
MVAARRRDLAERRPNGVRKATFRSSAVLKVAFLTLAAPTVGDGHRRTPDRPQSSGDIPARPPNAGGGIMAG